MLMSVGRGLAPEASAPYSIKLFLTTSLPREVTFERASAATLTNASGKLVNAGANQPRFDHNSEGKQLGLLIEGAATNKNTNYNANPTDTTGFTTSGSGTLSVVDDSAELAAAGLDLICTSGMVYKAEATTGSTFTVRLPGTVGNLNQHSMCLWARGTGVGVRTGRLYMGTSTTNIAPAGEGYALYKLEDQTPDSTIRTGNIIVDGNDTVYFILNQLEENSFCTSIIVTEGSSAARAADRPYIDNLDTYSWFDNVQGYIACRYYLPRLMTDDSYVAVAHSGSTANTIGIRMDPTNHDPRAYIRASSSLQFANNNLDYHVANSLNAAGLTWNASDTFLLSGGKIISDTISTSPSGITRLDIGSRNAGLSPLYGHVQFIEIGNQSLTLKQLGAKLQKQSDIVLGCGGQSLIRGHFASQESASEDGKQLHRATIGPALPEKAVIMVDGGTSSSAASKTTDDENFWWDLATSSRGPALDTFYSEMDDGGVTPTAILWAQGEADSHEISTSTSYEEYKQALENIFLDVRSCFGNIPVFIQRIGRRTSFSNTGGVQAVREAQQELIEAYDWCHDAAEIYEVSLYDVVHPDDAGYTLTAARNSASIIDVYGVDTPSGPSITGASRDGTAVTVTLTHNGGDDFTPASGIEGFRFFDDSSEITISSAVRSNANTITLTLASPPSGVETLYYGYDDLAGLTTSNAVHDNSANALPLRTAKITL